VGGEQLDVVVVGAGLAGLSAARRLVAAGRQVQVVEARDRVGGRVLNAVTGDGTIVEVGGRWIGPGQDRLGALADELGVAQYPTYNEGDNILVYRDRRSRYRGTIPKMPAPVLAAIGAGQLRLDRMARRVPLDEPWTARRAERWDSMTVETWLRRNVPLGPAREMLRLGVTSVFAAEPADLSLLHLLHHSHAGGLLDRLLGVAGGAQERRFVGGSQEVAIRLADGLGDAVRLAAPVRRIALTADRVSVEAGGERLDARFAVVAVPPTLAGRVPRAGLERGGVDPRVLRRPPGTRHAHAVRSGPPRAVWPDPLGGDGDLARVVRLHGGRGPLR